MADFDPVSFALGAASAKGGPGGASALSGLTDVDISNPTDGQTLVYNATSGKWENGSAGEGGGALIVHWSHDEEHGIYTLDKTWKEIADAILLGPVLLVYEDEYSRRVFSYPIAYVESTGDYTACFGNEWWFNTDTPSGYPRFIPD